MESIKGVIQVKVPFRKYFSKGILIDRNLKMTSVKFSQDNLNGRQRNQELIWTTALTVFRKKIDLIIF